MLLLNFGGNLFSRHFIIEEKPYLTQHVDYSVRAVHELRVLHKDLMPRNML